MDITDVLLLILLIQASRIEQRLIQIRDQRK